MAAKVDAAACRAERHMVGKHAATMVGIGKEGFVTVMLSTIKTIYEADISGEKNGLHH
jgi:hypothetical protein